MNKRTIFVEYEPFIGHLLNTKGLHFKIKKQDKKIDYILKINKWIKRDIILQILANNFIILMKRNYIAEYEFERLFGIFVKLTNFNTDFSYSLKNLEELFTNLEEKYLVEINVYNSKNEVKILVSDNLKKFVKDYSKFKINEDMISSHAEETYIHTLAHLILISCCVTSGSEFNDLDYIVHNNDVIIFDKNSGGNGSSDLIFEFLMKEEEFELEREIKEEFKKSTIMNPRYFDSIFFELLLPCMNSVVERTYFVSEEKASHYEFAKRLEEIEQRFKNRENLKEEIKKLNINNSYPYINSILERNDDFDDPDMELIKEAIDICIHGCPECSILGNQCQFGSRKERFNLSKIIQSLVFDEEIKDLISDVEIDNDQTIQKIKTTLERRNLALLKLNYTKYNPTIIEKFILSISGMELNGKYIKNCGQWFDVNIDDGTLIIYIMFRTKG